MITAFSFVQLGDHATALAILDELLKYHPDVPELYSAYGDVEALRGEMDKARAAYEKALKVALSVAAGTPRTATIQVKLERLNNTN